jgi:hypothetical protein
MDFKTAYAKFCAFVLEKLETNELNGTKLNGYRKASDSKEVLTILDAKNNAPISINNLIDCLIKFQIIFDNEYTQLNEKFYENKEFFSVYALLSKFVEDRAISINKTLINDDNHSLLKQIHTRVNEVFNDKSSINLKDLYKSIDSNNSNTLLEQVTKILNILSINQEAHKREMSNIHDQILSLKNDVKTASDKKIEVSLENKFRSIVNKVKNNFKKILHLEDEIKGIQTHIDTKTTPKILNKENFPPAHFENIEFVEKHNSTIERFQQELMDLSINELRERITKLDNDNASIRNQLEIDFGEISYVKSSLKLECKNVEEFFIEIKTQAENIIKTEMLNRDAKIKRKLNSVEKKQTNGEADEIKVLDEAKAKNDNQKSMSTSAKTKPYKSTNNIQKKTSNNNVNKRNWQKPSRKNNNNIKRDSSQNERPWRNPNNTENNFDDSTSNKRTNFNEASSNKKSKIYHKSNNSENNLINSNDQQNSKSSNLKNNKKYSKNSTNSFRLAPTTKAKS